MNKCKVDIYPILNPYQQELVDFGYPLIWQVVDENYDSLFESYDINQAIDFANKNSKSSHITKYVNVKN